MEQAALIGVSEDEFWDMLPREFTRRVKAYSHHEREEWNRAILIANQFRETPIDFLTEPGSNASNEWSAEDWDAYMEGGRS